LWHTLKDAATYITGLPKKESALPEWQTAIEVLMLCSRGSSIGSERASTNSMPPAVFVDLSLEAARHPRRVAVVGGVAGWARCTRSAAGAP
jgi:hypothetical protein